VRRRFFVGAADVHEVVMAIQFDKIDDYYTIADAASLTLPDGDWSIGIWTKVVDNSGNTYGVLVSSNNFGANNSIQLYLNEADAGDANKWTLNIEDGDGTNVAITSTDAPGGDSAWRLIVIQRDTTASEIQMWFCEAGAAASKEAAAADTDFAAVDASDWCIASRNDQSATRFWGGIACEFWKGNFCLTAAEMAALGTGLRPHDLGYSSDVYLEMFTADATLQDCFGSNNATRHDAPVSVDHPPMMRTPRQAAFNDAPSLY